MKEVKAEGASKWENTNNSCFAILRLCEFRTIKKWFHVVQVLAYKLFWFASGKREKILSEINVMTTLPRRHPNVVRYLFSKVCIEQLPISYVTTLKYQLNLLFWLFREQKILWGFTWLAIHLRCPNTSRWNWYMVIRCHSTCTRSAICSLFLFLWPKMTLMKWPARYCGQNYAAALELVMLTTEQRKLTDTSRLFLLIAIVFRAFLTTDFPGPIGGFHGGERFLLLSHHYCAPHDGHCARSAVSTQSQSDSQVWFAPIYQTINAFFLRRIGHVVHKWCPTFWRFFFAEMSNRTTYSFGKGCRQ